MELNLASRGGRAGGYVETNPPSSTLQIDCLFKSLSTTPSESPKILATSRIEIPLFPVTCPFTSSAFSSLLVVDNVPNARHLQQREVFDWVSELKSSETQ